ncbi:endonuclease domain-containing protein [Pedobacter roseus]|uniref:DUF559 domain-containing protein n=1 Tax=Pedobacter roseus TaxID=336820 RepID=A0A7G9QH03_9SPHI|nr:DUF559 domain-containing protein [Pedobacter roseus]QNN42628.1 DUF559 domain-containing protein [Pedobacter roseus]
MSILSPNSFLRQSKKEIEYYKARNTQFQLIHVVANVHTFRQQEDNSLIAYPYAISLVLGQKRGLPEVTNIKFVEKINLEKLNQNSYVYTDLSPFKAVYEGFYAHISFIFGIEAEMYTDTVGFILETYLLPLDIKDEDIPMMGPQDIDPEAARKYDKYRIKRFFKPFKDVTPRRIWGCDSPIELFLIQGLASKNIFPVIQTLIFKNGEIFDNYHMIEEKVFIKGDELITEVDLYFPEKKLAIFCDSTSFHRGKKNKDKDRLIDEELAKHGINVFRVMGKEIVDNLDGVLEDILKTLAQLK